MVTFPIYLHKTTLFVIWFLAFEGITSSCIQVTMYNIPLSTVCFLIFLSTGCSLNMPIFRVFINCVYLQGVEYYQCTYADSPKAWCATGVDSTGTVIPNQWGDCVVSSTSGCAQETITVPSCTTSSGPESGKACVFPFRYKGVVYKVTHHQIFDFCCCREK